MNGALGMGLLWMLSKVVEAAQEEPTPAPTPVVPPTPTVYMPPEVPPIVPTPIVPTIIPIPVSTQPPKPRPPMPVPTVVLPPGTMAQPTPTPLPTPVSIPKPRPPMPVPTPVSFPQPRPPITVPTPVSVPTPTVAPTPSLRTYRVKSGDTGEKIAMAFTGEKSRWRELTKVNPKIMAARADQVPKYGFPIYSGDVINLPASWEGISPPTVVVPPTVTPIPVSIPTSAPIPIPVSIPTSAPIPVSTAPIVSTYVVKSGDTGTSIAKKFTGDGNRWRELTKVNPTIMNARKAAAAKYGFPIYVGDVINLPADWAAAAPTASIAVGVADAAMRRASFFPSLANMLTANTAAQHAAQLTARAAKAMRSAERAPTPWPQAVPTDLPAFPDGWEPDEPIQPEIARRAWQLLPMLWRRGRGASATEQVHGRWVRFVARGPKRGVGVYRVRGACG